MEHGMEVNVVISTMAVAIGRLTQRPVGLLPNALA